MWGEHSGFTARLLHNIPVGFWSYAPRLHNRQGVLAHSLAFGMFGSTVGYNQVLLPLGKGKIKSILVNNGPNSPQKRFEQPSIAKISEQFNPTWFGQPSFT